MMGQTGLYPRLQAAGYAAAALLRPALDEWGEKGSLAALDRKTRIETARFAADNGAYHDQLSAPYPGSLDASPGEANRASIVRRRLREAESFLIDLGALDGPCSGPSRPCTLPRRFACFDDAHKAGVTVRPVCPACGSPNVRGYSDHSMIWDAELQHWLPTSGPENGCECDDCDADWPETLDGMELTGPVWEECR